jgi:hypothetical protein
VGDNCRRSWRQLTLSAANAGGLVPQPNLKIQAHVSEPSTSQILIDN